MYCGGLGLDSQRHALVCPVLSSESGFPIDAAPFDRWRLLEGRVEEAITQTRVYLHWRKVVSREAPEVRLRDLISQTRKHVTQQLFQ